MGKVRSLEELNELFDRSYTVNPKTDCWEWTRGRSKAGYGQFGHEGEVCYAHIFSYRRHKGEIPKGSEVCHTCDNPPCINPDHLFLGSHKENFEDASRKGRIARQVGELSGMAKLTEEQVLAIRKDPRPHRVIAKDYGISNRNVSGIKRRETWKHLEEE